MEKLSGLKGDGLFLCLEGVGQWGVGGVGEDVGSFFAECEGNARFPANFRLAKLDSCVFVLRGGVMKFIKPALQKCYWG